MPNVMIKCPQTGKPVPVGMSLPKEMLENPNAQIGGNSFGPCPSCGKMHTWEKEDAFIEGDEEEE